MKIIDMKFQYFNQHQNLYLTVENENGLIPKFENVITVDSGSHLHYGINEYGIVSFGLWKDDVTKRPGHGGFWSSRESVVGPLIGKNLVNVAINRISCSITEEALNKILPDEYHIVPKGFLKETIYEIHRKDGQNKETPYNEILSGNAPSYKYG